MKNVFWLAAALLTGILAVGMDELIISPVLPDIASSLHCQLDVAALGVSAYSLVIALVAPVLAPLGDRWPRRYIMMGELVLFAFASVICASSRSVAVFLVARALAGVAAGGIVPSTYAYVGDIIPSQQRGRVMGAVMSGWSLALVIGVPFGGWLGSRWGWRTTFVAIACLALLAATILGLLKPGCTRQASAQSRAGPGVSALRRVLRIRGVAPLIIATFCDMFGFYGAYTFLGPYIRLTHHAGSGFSGIIITSYGIGLALSPVMGRLADSVGHRQSLVAGLAALPMILAALPYVSIRTGWLLLALLGWGIGQSTVLTTLATLLSGLSPEHRGQVMGLYSLATNVAAAAAAAAMGPMFLALGYGWVCAVCAAATIAGTAVAAFSFKRAQSPHRIRASEDSTV
jgi:DHA1 family inner membrane transport protein